MTKLVVAIELIVDQSNMSAVVGGGSVAVSAINKRVHKFTVTYYIY